MKRRFWFGCPHEFSFPVKAADGSYYQVCILCGTEYGYDWKRMKRTKPLPRRVQQTSLEQRRPAASWVATATAPAMQPAAGVQPVAVTSPVASAEAMPEPVVAVAASARAHEQKSPNALSAAWAEIMSASTLVADTAEHWIAAARQWSSRNLRRTQVIPALSLAGFLVFAYVAAHRYGHAGPAQTGPEVAATTATADVYTDVNKASAEAVGKGLMRAAAKSEEPSGTVKKAISATPRASNYHGGGKKLKLVTGIPRVQTPVLVLGEALVTSQPEGAQVRFDGSSDPVFITPAVVGSIPPGRHRVVISKTGFIPQTMALEVAAGARSTLAARLVQQGSVFKIASTPAGATVLLDGKSTGLTSPAELRVTVGGAHTITLVQSGFLASHSQVSVKDGENFAVAFTMIPAGNAGNSKVVGGGIRRFLPGGSAKGMADVHFKTSPKGARLTLNGWSAPRTTPVELRLPPGGYNVVIQADGFKTFSKEIVLEAGQKIVLQESLERATGDSLAFKP